MDPNKLRVEANENNRLKLVSSKLIPSAIRKVPSMLLLSITKKTFSTFYCIKLTGPNPQVGVSPKTPPDSLSKDFRAGLQTSRQNDPSRSELCPVF